MRVFYLLQRMRMTNPNRPAPTESEEASRDNAMKKTSTAGLTMNSARRLTTAGESGANPSPSSPPESDNRLLPSLRPPVSLPAALSLLFSSFFFPPFLTQIQISAAAGRRTERRRGRRNRRHPGYLYVRGARVRPPVSNRWRYLGRFEAYLGAGGVF